MAPNYTLSDSESEAEPAVPSRQALERALRNEVAAKYKAKNYEELTVKRVRHAVEKKLGLELDYFRNTGSWKADSEHIIKDEFEILRTSAPDEELDSAKPTSPALPEPSQNPTNKRHKVVGTSKPRKRQKTQTPVSEEEKLSGGASEEEVVKPTNGAKRGRQHAKSKLAKEPSPEASAAEEKETDVAKHTAEATKDDSESEMSVVYDEEPKPKPVRKRKSGDGASKQAAPKTGKKAAAKGKDEDLDPDQAEIKRLQGWLVKCGVRKMWWRELQPYETPKAKIKHLKQMLEEVGMKGRYSLEKARQIRDERELKADLEQIQQGAKQWGTGSGDEGSDGPSDGPAPSRRGARGRQALAFLESDGEETD